MIHEPHNRIDVTTPQGDGVIWLVTEYGHETDTMYTIILDNGQIWQFTHKDIVVKDNVTFGRVFTKKQKPLGTVTRVTTDGMETFDIPNKPTNGEIPIQRLALRRTDGKHNTMSTSSGNRTFLCSAFVADGANTNPLCKNCGFSLKEHHNYVSAFDL
jgi:hypothetical protein